MRSRDSEKLFDQNSMVNSRCAKILMNLLSWHVTVPTILAVVLRADYNILLAH